MRTNIAACDLWGKYGLWIAVCVVVAILRPQRYLPIPFFYGWISLSISITLSIETVFSLACRPFATTRLYKPYVVKWLSWFVANSAAAFLAFGFLWLIAIAFIFGISDGLASGFALMIMVLPFPVVRLCVHIRDDLSKLGRSALPPATS